MLWINRKSLVPRNILKAGDKIMQGLKIYHGSRIEDLAEKLVGELKAERAAKGPFEFLKVAVANPNLGN